MCRVLAEHHALQAASAALQARNAELEAQQGPRFKVANDSLNAENKRIYKMLEAAEAQLKERDAEIERLRERLERDIGSVAFDETVEQLTRANAKVEILTEALEAALHDYNMSDTEFEEGVWGNGAIRELILTALKDAEELK